MRVVGVVSVSDNQWSPMAIGCELGLNNSNQSSSPGAGLAIHSFTFVCNTSPRFTTRFEESGVGVVRTQFVLPSGRLMEKSTACNPKVTWSSKAPPLEIKYRESPVSFSPNPVFVAEKGSLAEKNIRR